MTTVESHPDPSHFFVAGGTLHHSSPSYIKRPADNELLNLILAGKFCYTLTARQMGKSSLMVRTAQTLQALDIQTAIIDLTKIGTDVGVEQWYLGLITRLKVQLRLDVDPEKWWAERINFSAVQRFNDFLHDVVLVQCRNKVVIFVDEIDTTLNLTFSDDFFAMIRSTYNARATDPIYERLIFVLLGVATPADLIKNRNRTPFNIGEGIRLPDFTFADAALLKEGLQFAYPDEANTIFERIFYWTNGHPYLTQKLCLTAIEKNQTGWSETAVDDLVEKLFLSEEARKETNLQFVSDSIITNSQRRQLLGLYHQVYRGKIVPENERSPLQNRLKLFGLVGANKGNLVVRNEIYRQVFDRNWIKTNTPGDWTRRLMIAALGLIILLLLIIYRQRQEAIRAEAQVSIDNFRNTTSADVRVTSLAKLFELPGFEDEAFQLFFEELSREEQLAIFALDNPATVASQLITTIRRLYTRVPVYIDLESHPLEESLLYAMGQVLRKLDDPVGNGLATEIEQWLAGRAQFGQKAYEPAINLYNVAIGLNDQHPGTYFDRGLVYAAQEQMDMALADFETVINLDREWEPLVKRVIEGNSKLYSAFWAGRQTYSGLAAVLVTATVTPQPTATPLIPFIVVSPDCVMGVETAEITVQGSNWTAQAEVVLLWQDEVLIRVTADSDGFFVQKVMLTAISDGEQRILAVIGNLAQPRFSTSDTFQVPCLTNTPAAVSQVPSTPIALPPPPTIPPSSIRPSPTATFVSTATPFPTSMPTIANTEPPPTAGYTPTPTSSHTPTLTPTATPLPTPFPTDTPVIPTNPPMPTNTATATLTASPTITPTSLPAPSIILLPACGMPVADPGQVVFNIYFMNWPTNESLTLLWEGNQILFWQAGQHTGTFTQTYSPVVPQKDAAYTVTALSGGGATDSKLFTVPCLGPDLLTIGPPQLISTPPIVAYQPVQFSILIANAGGTNVNVPFAVDIYLDPDPSTVLSTTILIEESDGYSFVSFIAGGETRLITVTAYQGFANPTPHVVYGFVDSSEQVVETDETNNITALTGIQVTPAATPTPPATPGGGMISGSAFILGNLQAQVFVRLINESNGQTIAITTTDQGGYYSFSGVPAGTTYTVAGCITIDGETWSGWLSGIVPPNTTADIILIQQPCS